MKAITTYLNFDGTTKEAMTFYAKCLEAELQLMPFSDMPGDHPKGAEERIMHARLTKGSAEIMASDIMPGMPFHPGNNFAISVHCESLEEIQKVFGALSDGGQVTMPLQDTFWGAHFGMLKDKFGTQWMFNFEKPKA